jgi:hypothetical protein
VVKLPYRYRPGPGFVLLVATVAGGAGFFAWGLRTPPLDQVWQMQVELRIGDRDALSMGEMELLQATLTRYPDLADHMLEGADSGLISASVGGVVDRGYAYLVRKTPGADSVLVVGSTMGESLEVEVTTTGYHDRGVATGDESFASILPQDGLFPQLVGVHLARPKQRSTPPSSAPNGFTPKLQLLAGTGILRGFPPMRVDLVASR